MGLCTATSQNLQQGNHLADGALPAAANVEYAIQPPVPAPDQSEVTIDNIIDVYIIAH
jgi:hypothetical protein